MLDRIKRFWANRPTWQKFLIIPAVIIAGIILLKIVFLILAFLLFGGSSDEIRYTLPGFLGYAMILALLVGGVVSGEKDNKASVILALATTGVLFFFFTPIVTRWIGAVVDVIPAPLVAGVFLIGLAILAKKMLDTQKMATVLFIGGTVFIVLSIVPLVLPSGLKQSFLSASSNLPVQKISGTLITFGLIKSVLVGACLLFWIKSPSSVTRLLIAGLLIVGIYRYSDSAFNSFLASHHTTQKAIETQRTVGRNTLRRFIDRVTAGDRRSEVLSHKKIAKTGVFYIPKEASLCKDITGGVCMPATGITLVNDFTKVFIIEGGTKTVGNYSWELVALGSPASKQRAYVFAGDLVENIAEAKTQKTAELKKAGWVEVSVSEPDADGFSSVTIPTDKVGKKIVNFRSCLYTQTRSNGVPSQVWAPRKLMSFSTPIKKWFVDVKFVDVPPDGKCLAKFQ